MNTYLLCKKMIALGKIDNLTAKLDVFLLNNRITETEYNELVALITI